MGDGTTLGHFRKDIAMVDSKGRPERHFAYAFDEVAAQAQAAATVVTGGEKLPFGPGRSAESVTRVVLVNGANGSGGGSVGPQGPPGPPARRADGVTRVVLLGSTSTSSASSANWVPLALGTEPLTFVSNGAGRPIFVPFTP